MASPNFRDIELAYQVVAARLAGDEETVIRVIRENPQLGNTIISVACALMEALAKASRQSVEELTDMVLMAAAQKAREETQ